MENVFEASGNNCNFFINSNDNAYIAGLICNSKVHNSFIVPDIHSSMYKTFNHLIKPYCLFKDKDKSARFVPKTDLQLESFKHIIDSNNLPEISVELLEFYIRGLYERNNPKFTNVVVRHESRSVLEGILKVCNIRGVITKGEINFILTFNGSNKLDFLHYIYKSKGRKSSQHFKRYLKLCNPGGNLVYLQLKYSLNLKGAVPPSKDRASDSGYDMTLISELKRVGNVIFYDTGVSVQPPDGFYFDLIGRSSISKSGYILANNMGVIDRSYTGNVIVALVKIDPAAPDLTLPNRLVQIIPRRIVHMNLVCLENLESTNRADNGFGSSNNKHVLQSRTPKPAESVCD